MCLQALSIVCLIRLNVIDHFRVHLSLHIWACLCVKSLLCLSIFIQTEIEITITKSLHVGETEGNGLFDRVNNQEHFVGN